VLVPRALDHVGDGNDGGRGTRAEACRGQARRQSAPTGEPLHRVADARAVHGAGADTAEHRGEIEHPQGIGEGIDRPGEAAERAANDDHPSRPEAIDQVALSGHQPGLEQNEYGERDLDGSLGPMVLGPDGPDEQGPAVLQVGDHDHADQADD